MASGLDYGIIIGYFVVILAFGAAFGGTTKSTSDFFFAGRRFPWWLIAASMLATVVGSYSFIKYSQMAYTYGFSSTMTYLNDWFWMPLLMFGWLPIIFYSRISSIPEYFERRFNRATRNIITVLLLLYMVGYVGINLYTMGKGIKALLGWDVFAGAALVAVVCAVYVAWGGQTSVIMTDLAQGAVLLIAGILIVVLGTTHLSGSTVDPLLPNSHLHAFAPFNSPPDFNFVGIFWQDFFGSSAAFYFLNQGLAMRFLSARSVGHSRKALLFTILILMPVAAFSVSGAGWVGKALVENGDLLHADMMNRGAFVVTASFLTNGIPGLFGFIMAALMAALMSTADTLINASSAVWVNDVWRPYIKKNQPDAHYLKVARWTSIAVAIVGLALVPLYMSFGTIYAAHGAFTAAITPPMVVVVLLGAFWKRYHARAAFWTLAGGIIAIVFSMIVPEVIFPFAHGVEKGGEGFKAYYFMRACYGVVVCTVIGVLVTLFTKPKEKPVIKGLTWDTIKEGIRLFKGGEANERPGKKVKLTLKAIDESPVIENPGWSGVTVAAILDPKDLEVLQADEGDHLHVSHPSAFKGTFRSLAVRVVVQPGKPGVVQIPRAALDGVKLVGQNTVVVEKTI